MGRRTTNVISKGKSMVESSKDVLGLIGSTIQNGSIPRLFSNCSNPGLAIQIQVVFIIWDLKVTFPSLDSLDVCFKKSIVSLDAFTSGRLLEAMREKQLDDRNSAELSCQSAIVWYCTLYTRGYAPLVCGFNLLFPSYLDGCSPQREEMVHTFLTWYWGSLSI